MKKIFDFSGYKDFLKACELARRHFERGFRSKLAESLGCQSGYISHVLNGDAHFSLEQTMKASAFLHLDPTERKYFLLLVEFDRAGTKELKDHFKEELRHEREEFLNIKSRVGDSRTLTEAEQSTYYSSWQYLAVHVLSSLNGYDDMKSIAQALRIPEKSATQILMFLSQTGIIKEVQGKLKPGITQVHLNRESPLIRQHHTNWRIAAVQSLTSEAKEDIHYSTVSTLSAKDAENLRAEMVKLIEKYVETVKPSSEEVMFGFNLDFYNLLKK
jgi:uncharacterized protein (TIGR02147 family)